MKSSPSNSSHLETECLFGEMIEVLEEHLEWVYCRLITDSYCGWVPKNSLGELKETTHRVLSLRTFVYQNMDVKSNILTYLPLGSRLVIYKIESGWAKTSIIINNKAQEGYVPSKDIVDNKHQQKDWVSIAETLNETPYKWGGRDTIGIDCSALLQLSYQTYGQNIPRNSSQQIKLKKKEIDNFDNLKRGCVIFWKGHVGIMIDKVSCIHANAFHMKTTIEPLVKIIDRMNKTTNIIKMMDFN